MPNNSEYKTNNYFRVAILAIISTTVFLVTCIFGEGLGGSLGSNPMCYKYLGCTEGFMGYDALEHFLFGLASVWTLIWLFQRFPQHSLFQEKSWKNVLIVIALIMMVSVFWEFLEWFIDIYRANFLHQTLIDWKLNINLLNQPSNTDTMGDLLAALIGSTIALFITKPKEN